ncbi:MAG TPA: hypothetical protein VNM15_02210 [Candidatus Binatia bacterium]|nr:hypothetical protein [Candidatus Binatia bacterium]
MKHPPKNLAVFVFGAFLAFGIFCTTMVAPRQAGASLSGCSGMAGETAMRGCENPQHLCGLGFSGAVLARGALKVSPSKDSFKSALGLDLGALGVNVGSRRAPPGAGENTFLIKSHKVSVRLFNATLNL